MRVWAIGIVYLYVALGIFNWVTGLHWLAEFSLPVSVLAGVGLAIASHANKVEDITATVDNADIEDATPSPRPEATVIAQPLPSVPDGASPAVEPSISFTIHKNVRPS